MCYKPRKSYDAAIKWCSSPKTFEQVQAKWEQRQLDRITAEHANVGAVDDEGRLYQENFANGTLHITQSVDVFLRHQVHRRDRAHHHSCAKLA